MWYHQPAGRQCKFGIRLGGPTVQKLQSVIMLDTAQPDWGGGGELAVRDQAGWRWAQPLNWGGAGGWRMT